MAFLGRLLYKYYHFPLEKRKLIKNYGGIKRYEEMGRGELEMRSYALNKLTISSPFNKAGKFKLNFITGEKYIHQTLFCIYSFSKWLSNEEATTFSISIYGDPSLKQETVELLTAKFPQLLIFEYDENVKKVREKYPAKKYPFINRKITELFLFNKLFFVHADDNLGLKIFLDSDMLFTNRPTAFLNWINENHNNQDHAFVIQDIMRSYGYNDKQLAHIAEREIDHQLNVGFYGIHTANVDFEKIENLIKRMEENYGSSYYMEQFTTSILLSDQKNLTVLPPKEYIVWPTPGDVEAQSGDLHHYVSTSKYDYFTKAWRKLI